MTAILGGLAAAILWATATLASSRSSRMIGSRVVLAWVMIVGSIVGLPLAAVSPLPDPVPTTSLPLLLLAGVAYAGGLGLTYRALTIGQVSIVAPIVATEGAIGAVIAVALGDTIGLSAAILLGVIAIGVKLAGALESAHRRNLVHGDLRPEDVLVTDDGEPHLADLGLALVTGVGPDRATDPARIAHAAPEQLETHVPTRESDIYGLGSVLYALLAGSPAFLQPDLRPQPREISCWLNQSRSASPSHHFEQ